MNRLLLFLRKVYVGAIFILLESLSLHFYANSSAYTQAKLLTASNVFVGGVNSMFASVRKYFNLNDENQLLVARLAELENELEAYRAAVEEYELHNKMDVSNLKFIHTPARVINNTVSHQQNFITIDRGWGDGVRNGMAVLTADGCMLGYVVSSAERYSVCMSVLNTEFRASGRPTHSGEFGSISWDGKDRRFVTLSEIPKYTPIQEGDTIVSTAYSFYFPEGVRIGTVDKITNSDNSPSSTIRVRLSADVMTTDKVVLVENRDAEIIMNLEESLNETK